MAIEITNLVASDPTCLDPYFGVHFDINGGSNEYDIRFELRNEASSGYFPAQAEVIGNHFVESKLFSRAVPNVNNTLVIIATDKNDSELTHTVEYDMIFFRDLVSVDYTLSDYLDVDGKRILTIKHNDTKGPYKVSYRNISHYIRRNGRSYPVETTQSTTSETNTTTFKIDNTSSVTNGFYIDIEDANGCTITDRSTHYALPEPGEDKPVINVYNNNNGSIITVSGSGNYPSYPIDIKLIGLTSGTSETIYTLNEETYSTEYFNTQTPSQDPGMYSVEACNAEGVVLARSRDILVDSSIEEFLASDISSFYCEDDDKDTYFLSFNSGAGVFGYANIEVYQNDESIWNGSVNGSEEGTTITVPIDISAAVQVSYDGGSSYLSSSAPYSIVETLNIPDPVELEINLSYEIPGEENICYSTTSVPVIVNIDSNVNTNLQYNLDKVGSYIYRSGTVAAKPGIIDLGIISLGEYVLNVNSPSGDFCKKSINISLSAENLPENSLILDVKTKDSDCTVDLYQSSDYTGNSFSDIPEGGNGELSFTVSGGEAPYTWSASYYNFYHIGYEESGEIDVSGDGKQFSNLPGFNDAYSPHYNNEYYISVTDATGCYTYWSGNIQSIIDVGSSSLYLSNGVILGYIYGSSVAPVVEYKSELDEDWSNISDVDYDGYGNYNFEITPTISGTYDVRLTFSEGDVECQTLLDIDISPTVLPQSCVNLLDKAEEKIEELEAQLLESCEVDSILNVKVTKGWGDNPDDGKIIVWFKSDGNYSFDMFDDKGYSDEYNGSNNSWRGHTIKLKGMTEEDYLGTFITFKLWNEGPDRFEGVDPIIQNYHVDKFYLQEEVWNS